MTLVRAALAAEARAIAVIGYIFAAKALCEARA